MNILDRWIFNSIDLNNLETPMDKTGYVLCTFLPREGMPYSRWLKCDKDGYMYCPEQKCFYMHRPNQYNVFNENVAIPMARITELE